MLCTLLRAATGAKVPRPLIGLLALLITTVLLATAACGDGGKGDTLVYTSEEESVRNIYIREKGEVPVRLTSGPAQDSSPRLSPDGKLVAFVSDRNGSHDVFVIDKSGDSLTQISDGSGTASSPRWSPDGDMLAFVLIKEGEGTHIYLSNVEEPNPHRLTAGELDEGPPAWSPDGKWIAFSLTDEKGEGQGIFLRNPGGVNQITFTEGPDFWPYWSPDSVSLVFQSSRNGDDDIYIIDLDESFSGQPRRVTTNPSADRMPRWSPDGKWIAFISERDENPEVYVMTTDGTVVTRLTINQAVEDEITWAQDGKLAFVSHLHGNADVFIMDSDGTAQAQVTTGTGPDTQPHW